MVNANIYCDLPQIFTPNEDQGLKFLQFKNFKYFTKLETQKS